MLTILGATGILGTAITRQLACRGTPLRLVGRRLAPLPSRHAGHVEVFATDLIDPTAVADAITGADTIIHLVAHTSGPGGWRAAGQEEIAERVNLGVLTEVLTAIGQQRRSVPPVIVFAGTTSQVGKPGDGLLTGSEPDQPQTAYDRHKLAAEQALEQATADGLVRGITLRLPTLFSQRADPGAFDKGVVAAMTRRALAGEPLTMWDNGTARRDLLCADDAASAFLSALDNVDRLAGGHWLIGSGQAISVAQLFTLIAEVVAEVTGTLAVPVTSVPPPNEAVGTDEADFLPDPAAFHAATGWEPQIPLRTALANLAMAATRCL